MVERFKPGGTIPVESVEENVSENINTKKLQPSQAGQCLSREESYGYYRKSESCYYSESDRMRKAPMG